MVILYCDGHYMIENPLNSMALHSSQTLCCVYNAEIHLAPRLQLLFGNRPLHVCHTWLGMFGATTPKPVKLFSNESFVLHLYRTDRNTSHA